MAETPEQARHVSHKKRYVLWIVLIVAVVLVGGGLFTIFTTNADCVWSAPVGAWIDLNGDGVHDPGEPPLESVEFFVNDHLNKLDKVGHGRSDFNGQGGVSVWLPGCPSAKFEIEAEVPRGYKLTTKSPLEVTGQGYGDKRLYEFGFAPLPGTVLSTPYAPSMSCSQYPSFEADDIVATQKGIWTASFGKASRLDPGNLSTEEVIDFPKKILSADFIVPTEHGLWVDDLVEWGYFDGKTWSVFDFNPSEAIWDIAPSASQSDDGHVWFVAREFLIDFEPNAGKIEVFLNERIDPESVARIVIFTKNHDWFAARIAKKAELVKLFDSSWQVVFDQTLTSSNLTQMPTISSTEYAGSAIGTDGSIWIADIANLVRYVPSTRIWLEYNPSDAGSSTFQYASDIAADADGDIWLADGRAVLRVTPLSDSTSNAKWQKYDARDGFQDQTAEHITIDPNGTIWLAGENRSTLNKCQLLDKK